jgi:hypothetical protein
MKPNRAFQESKEARIRQTFRAELFRFVPKRVRDETLAEDIVRDAFITDSNKSSAEAPFARKARSYGFWPL